MSPLKLSDDARVTGERPWTEYVSAASSANVIVVMLNFSILTLPLDVRTRATPSKTSPVMLAEPAVMLETPAAGRARRAAVCLMCGRAGRLGCGGPDGVASTGGLGDAEAVGDGVAVGVTLGAGDALAVADGVGLPVGDGAAALLEPPRRAKAPLGSTSTGRLDADSPGAKSPGTDAG
jgi:hypothetical protein